jgi:hypothetical protein
MDGDAVVGRRGSVEVESARWVGDVKAGVKAAVVRVWRREVGVGLNPPRGSLLGYSPEEGRGENLDSGVYPCPSWKVTGEEGDKLVEDETLP